VRVPCPACDGVVDNGGPDKHEDDAGEHAATLCDGTNGKCDPVRSVSLDKAPLLEACLTYVMAANMPWYTAKSRSGIL
jgi:hypothetical protein